MGKMIPFNAMAIKSPLIIHDKLGLVGGGASGIAMGLRGALKSIPIVGIAYSTFEMGVRAATDMFILQNVADNSLNFFDAVDPMFYMKFPVEVRENPRVQMLIDKGHEKVWSAWETMKSMKTKSAWEKEMADGKEAKILANKLADYLSRIVITGYAQKIFLQCYSFIPESVQNDDVCYGILAAITVNHPNGYHKLSLSNKEAKKENEIMNKNHIPDKVREAVIEYWNVVSKGIKISQSEKEEEDGKMVMTIEKIDKKTHEKNEKLKRNELREKAKEMELDKKEKKKHLKSLKDAEKLQKKEDQRTRRAGWFGGSNH